MLFEFMFSVSEGVFCLIDSRSILFLFQSTQKMHVEVPGTGTKKGRPEGTGTSSVPEGTNDKQARFNVISRLTAPVL